MALRSTLTPNSPTKCESSTDTSNATGTGVQTVVAHNRDEFHARALTIRESDGGADQTLTRLGVPLRDPEATVERVRGQTARLSSKVGV